MNRKSSFYIQNTHKKKPAAEKHILYFSFVSEKDEEVEAWELGELKYV